jgi:hypothetical protein
MMPSLVDKRRIKDGAKALALPKAPESLEEMEETLEAIWAGAAALQSTEIHSAEINEQIEKDFRELVNRASVLEEKIRQIKAN